MKHALRARDWAGEWRFAALAGATAGSALAPLAPPDPSLAAAGALPIAAIGLAALRPGDGARPTAALTWLALLALVATLAGFLIGGARVRAIDAGALRARSGAQVSLTGFVAGVPRRSRGDVEVRVDSPGGRVLVIAPEPVAELPVGSEVRAEGVLEKPEPWRTAYLRRQGIAMTLRTDRIDESPGGRRGLTGWIDEVRLRAERALGRGMPEREAALARGFVLGEDDRIDPRTREDFQRSNLAHLLAVSGENVILLGVLAWPLLALLGLPLRARLIGTLCLIAIYVPVTGAGPSIQRAGVMGAAGLIAALADRPRSRWYAVLLAAAATLALNPRADRDVGWQLSFAAVIGIMLWSKRLTGLVAGDADRRSARRALAEAIAVTTAATVATAPLMAAAFEQFSPAALPANVLAAPAVAPAMWLGMLTGIVGQAPFLPVEPFNWLDSLCLAYIAQVAHWLAAPGWASLTVHLGSTWAVASAYAALVVGMEFTLRWLRAGLELRRDRRPSPKDAPVAFASEASGLLRRMAGWPALALLTAAIGAAVLMPFRGQAALSPPTSLTVRVLDVGQGDSILLDPPDGDAVLVDTGPAEDRVEDRLRELGVDRLAAIVITHNQSDHAGDLGPVLGSVRVDRLVYGRDDPRLRAAALASGVEPYRLAEGGELDSGGLHLTALWPPRELLHDTGQDPNLLCLVLVARWRHFSMLLTGDAEAESVPIDPGAVDVLKVAHHGSEDAGLDRLLERSVPRLAVISVGAGNPFGHPDGRTLADLDEHEVPTLRTDSDGEIDIEADGSRWTVGPGAG
ncbi:MAG TPA: ComEC/Rec2 family competence protein [Solirubrobacterales bacterium]|nr:ComEC/Rec2 family competence protein [Solirubrobacterales bacterium]